MEHSQELPLNFWLPVNSESQFCFIQWSTQSPPWLCGHACTCVALGTRDGAQRVSKVHAHGAGIRPEAVLPYGQGQVRRLTAGPDAARPG